MQCRRERGAPKELLSRRLAFSLPFQNLAPSRVF
jgi:hypothetical protein